MTKLSIIIPAYNAERFIQRTLDSIYDLEMPENSFEVIVVDDCSTDNTIDVVLTYQRRFGNLVLLKQSENHKQGAARNRALRVAKGNYVTFVDADDEVIDGLPNAVDKAISKKPDILICHYYRINEQGERSEWKLKNEPTEVVDGRTFMEKHYDWFFVGAPWGYLIKSDYIENLAIPFAEDVFTEDVDWITQHLYYAKTIEQCQDIIYCNNFCAGSASTGGRNWFRVACVVLEAYRELVWAEKIKNTDKRMYDWLVEVAQYKIDYQMKRLWKIEGRNFKMFYQKIGFDVCRNLSTLYTWNRITSFLLSSPKFSIIILNTTARVLQHIKQIKENL